MDIPKAESPAETSAAPPPESPIKELGITLQPDNSLPCLLIVGEIEGHMLASPQTKTTKYEHMIPLLVAAEQNPQIQGMLVVLNTVGGDVEAGLALAEMISSLSKPTVSLVLGGGHSIGVTLAVSTHYSFITPTATMTVHPLRMSGMIITVAQTYEYFNKMQERVLRFVTAHSSIKREALLALMLATGELANDIGTVLVGQEAVDYGLINEVGGLSGALQKLKQLVMWSRPD